MINDNMGSSLASRMYLQPTVGSCQKIIVMENYLLNASCDEKHKQWCNLLVKHFTSIIEKNITLGELLLICPNPSVGVHPWQPFPCFKVYHFKLFHVLFKIRRSCAPSTFPQLVLEHFTPKLLLVVLPQVPDTEPVLCMWKVISDSFDQTLKEMWKTMSASWQNNCGSRNFEAWKWKTKLWKYLLLVRHNSPQISFSNG